MIWLPYSGPRNRAGLGVLDALVEGVRYSRPVVSCLRARKGAATTLPYLTQHLLVAARLNCRIL